VSSPLDAARVEWAQAMALRDEYRRVVYGPVKPMSRRKYVTAVAVLVVMSVLSLGVLALLYRV